MNQRECPYCDHPNPASFRFCSACGAAMHLAPCTHCGAVNDISASACYRCHGELVPLDTAEATNAETAPDVAIGAGGEAALADNEPADASEKRTDAPPRTGPSLLVIGIILFAFAAASYFAFRQRSTLDTRPGTAPVSSSPPAASPSQPQPQPQSTSPAQASGNISAPRGAAAGGDGNTASKPATAATPASTPPTRARDAAPPKSATADKAAPAPTPAAIATPSSRPPSSSPARAAPTVTTPAAATAAPAPSSPPAAPSAPVNCTEAVAALGLCKPADSK